MARTINHEAHAAKRNEILDVAQGLIYSKGYEKMTVLDIRSALEMSSGAFFHYFDSKMAVLESLVERMQTAAEAPLNLIAENGNLTARDKLYRFFTAFDGMRMDHHTMVLELLRVWYTDDNALVRQKVDEALLERRAPLLNAIVQQGIAEGTFDTPYPTEAALLLHALLQGMSTHHAKTMLAWQQNGDTARCMSATIATHDACMTAIERVLGVTNPFLYRLEADAVEKWLTLQHESTRVST